VRVVDERARRCEGWARAFNALVAWADRSIVGLGKKGGKRCRREVKTKEKLQEAGLEGFLLPGRTIEGVCLIHQDTAELVSRLKSGEVSHSGLKVVQKPRAIFRRRVSQNFGKLPHRFTTKSTDQAN
jgi:hypothetical protein